jgi:esterase
MIPTLSHTIVTEVEEPSHWLYILHGIYGSGRNWGSVARRLVTDRPEWGVVLVDLRLHGGSTGFPPPHTLDACAADVRRLEEELGRPATGLLGHSFGGKVALVRSADASPALSQVWVMDSTLRVGEPSGSPWEVVGIVRSLPDRFESREELAKAMERHGYGLAVGRWLAMNLERGEDGFRWKLDWDGVEEMLRDYFRTDVWEVVENPPRGAELHVVKAAESSALDEATVARLEKAGSATGRVHIHTLAGGHWINVDNPDGVLDLLVERLPA